ncbi:ParA family partition ATPase [Ruixingdingia sedimenti]|uniref:ParA family partition ATPase n=1 Tax=Ruixingdingia sedimenti TaxID=3073604 RepID=A0ABU1F2Q8_9RHOB|nr:ParA family partition ATPase [Xinfangfangia sp. LG-4]MDR5651141.1 ParA family partition ATPase [Xinfangfangia sp. LG-4]
MGGLVITVAQQKGGSGKTTLAVNLAVELLRAGRRVALLDTDPQGSLGRWFMTRRDRGGEDPGLDFSTASAWGVGYECDKLRRQADVVIVDTPPKADADLRPALRVADLVLVPVATSHVDLWATEGVLDLCARERKRVLIVLNRAKAGTRLAAEVAGAAAEMAAGVAAARLGNRIAFAESLGQGRGASEMGRGPAAEEAAALLAEILAHAAPAQGDKSCV